MADPDRMTAWQFLRWFTANHGRVQLAAVAASIAFGVLVVASVPLGLDLSAWAAVTACAATTIVYLACGWLVLGSRRVQQWITGL